MPSRSTFVTLPPESRATCTACGEPIVGEAVLCNVYRSERWVGSERYHTSCYRDAGDPHGSVGAASNGSTRTGLPAGFSTKPPEGE